MKLEVVNISKSYTKKKRALSNVNMTLTPGIYGLLGPNGAGKSTLMNIITDNIKPDEGQVLFNGEDIHSLKDKYRAILGYMPQQQSLYDDLTGEEFLWYMAALKDLKKRECADKIENLLKIVNLYNEKDKKIGLYSGGMKQRILIAQALLNDPEILVMDEPTAGLDPSERIRLRSFFETIGKDKIVLIATHIVSDIESIAKEIIFLKEGTVVSCESAKRTNEEEIISELEQRYMQIFGTI